MGTESRRFASRAETERVDLDTDHVVELVVGVDRRLGLAPSEEVERLELAATLHSIGTLAEPQQSPAPSLVGERVELSLAQAQSLYEAAAAAGPAEVDDVSEVLRAVGERWDGHGYPDGIAGGEIPMASRVIHACETYDSLTADREGDGMSPLEACRELVDQAGSQLDPLVVATLIGHLRRTHVLTIVDPEPAEDEVQRSAAWSASSSSG